MSFILDAIAKSEAERKQRDVPSADVLAFPGGGPPSRRKTWPWLLAGAALLLNGVLLYLLLAGQRPVTEPGAPAGEQAVTAAPAAPTPPVAIAPPPAAVEPAGAGAGSAVTASRAPQPADSRPGEAPPPAPADGDAARAAPSAAGEAGWLQVRPDSLSREIDAAARAADAPAAGAAAPLFNRVVSAAELPDDLRAELPKVSFSGHLYSSNPASSLVFVGNGRPVITGQAIERDLVLHEITPTGVVVAFRGYLIEVGVLQNWTLD